MPGRRPGRRTALVAAVALACLLGADQRASGHSAPRPASTIVIEQHGVDFRRLTHVTLTCAGDECEHVVRLDMAGTAFDMRMRIVLDRMGAWFTLRGCEMGGPEPVCDRYGTGAVDALLVPLDRNGFGRRAFVISRIPPPVQANPPGVDPSVLPRDTVGPRFRLLIEVARRPD